MAPDHLVFVVFDSLRPDFLDRFDMPNLKRFRDESRNYRNAYVGYVGAETVVSHLAFAAGQPPKNLPYSDDVFFDDKGLLGTKGAFYATAGLNPEQLAKLLGTLPRERFLAARVKEHTGGTTYAIGEKDYAATVFGAGADAVITLKKKEGRCAATGRNVPAYILNSQRFSLECRQPYGTEKTYYPYDGARFVPGHDPKHLGGDTWVMDAAKEEMRNEKSWRGLFLTFGAIDKVSHMLGEHEGQRPPQTRKVKTEYPLAKIAQIADAQFGALLEELARQGLTERTLIVVTADHGAQPNYHYLGNGQTSKWGKLVNDGKESPQSKWVRHFAKDSGLAFTLQDSFIRGWLQPKVDAKTLINKISEVPGVVEIYQKGEGGYERKFSALAKQPPAFRQWAEAHDSELLAAYASPNSPDIVGLLADHYGFDLMGDHGGAQERVQRVPIIIHVPGEEPASDETPKRLYEIYDEIAKTMAF